MREQAHDRSAVRTTLLEIRSVFVEDGWDHAVRLIEALLDLLDSGDDEAFGRAVTSGEIWGHMGSLFDYTPLTIAPGRFDDLQLRLANELSRVGFTGPSMEFHATLLRGELPPGWHRNSG